MKNFSSQKYKVECYQYLNSAQWFRISNYVQNYIPAIWQLKSRIQQFIKHLWTLMPNTLEQLLHLSKNCRDFISWNNWEPCCLILYFDHDWTSVECEENIFGLAVWMPNIHTKFIYSHFVQGQEMLRAWGSKGIFPGRDP